jgi:hypothetical protein
MARFESGYIKWHRKAFFGDIGTNIHCLGLWVALLSMATWRDSKVIWNGAQRDLPPGSVLIGIRELATNLGCSKDTVSRWLRYLSETRRICVEHATRGTLITIENWALYQSDDEIARHQSDTDETLAGHDTPPIVGRQPTLIEEEKKRRRKKRESTSVFDFEAIWLLYPKRVNKVESFARFCRLIKTQEDYEKLSLAIKHYSDHCDQSGYEIDRIRQLAYFLEKDGEEGWRGWIDPPSARSLAQPKKEFKFDLTWGF